MMDARSERNLVGVHPDLVLVVRQSWQALQGRPDGLGFIVIEGLRSRARQAELVKAGASQTMNGRHLTGHAVDLMATVNGRGRWDWPLYRSLAEAVKAQAANLKTPIVWGGDWRTLRDGPHYELDRRAYPA